MYFVLFSLLSIIAPINNLLAKDFKQTILFKEKQYFHLHAKKFIQSLKDYDILELSIHNPTKKKKLFYLVIEDNKSIDYWSKLNFKSTLLPGDNKLTFDLKRFVGQRGSVRKKRKIDYRNLEKIFFIVNPDTEKIDQGYFKVNSISLNNRIKLHLPDQLLAFKFIGQDIDEQIPEVFSRVNENTFFDDKRGYGFEQINLWRKAHSHILPALLSHTLNVTYANFKIKLPNGKYKLALIWDELGYWDVPFWSKRILQINSQLVLKQTRDEFHFLKDLFRFTKEPKASDHPFTSQITHIFKNNILNFEVNDGKVQIEFSSDPSGAALNTLLIWPSHLNEEAKKFQKTLFDYAMTEFDTYSRQVMTSLFKNNQLRILNCESSLSEIPNETFLSDGYKTFDFCLSLPGKEKVYLSLTDFKSNKYVIPKKQFVFKIYNYQFKSVDLNHETYQLRPFNLKPIKSSFLTNGYHNRPIQIELLGNNFPSGNYHGQIIVSQGELSKTFELNFNIISQKIPQHKMKIGLIGLNAFPAVHFKGDSIKFQEQESLIKSFEMLKAIGVNQFTDMPAPIIRYKEGYKSFDYSTKNILALISKTDNDKVFLYNDQLSQELLSDHSRNAGQSKENYEKNKKRELAKILNNLNKAVVFLYSDEATGYRDAIDFDLSQIKILKDKLPGIKLGGFGNLYDWSKASKLYTKWDFGFYSDIPHIDFIKKLSSARQRFGVYNLCAEPLANLEFCFGIQLFRLHQYGIHHYFEWHAAAIHNYPGLDLDGRESDICFLTTDATAKIYPTTRYVAAGRGINTFHKLLLLQKYLDHRKDLEHKEIEAKKWLASLMKTQFFPIKHFYDRNQSQTHSITAKLDSYLNAFFIQ